MALEVISDLGIQISDLNYIALLIFAFTCMVFDDLGRSFSALYTPNVWPFILSAFLKLSSHESFLIYFQATEPKSLLYRVEFGSTDTGSLK